MEKSTILIGICKFITPDGYALYFRTKDGWKHRVSIWDGYGVKDLYMMRVAPNMTEEEFKELPDKIEPESIETFDPSKHIDEPEFNPNDYTLPTDIP